MSVPQVTGKDTIYVDVDDEITSIIDKVRGSKQQIVALVLPKRAAVLQSVVNMKLLKRTADSAKKQVVLVTTESGLMPLAGVVGLYVAATPQSKPEIPVAPVVHDNTLPSEEELTLDDEPDTEYTAENAGDKPIGELTKGAALGAVATAGMETVNLDDEPAAAATAAKPVKGTDKKLKVPNFNRFKMGIGLAVLGLVLLGFLLYLCLAVLPKATIAISTNASDVNSSFTVTLDSTVSTVNTATNSVPATAVQQQKTYTQQADATGKQNNGDKAKGTVNMTTCVTNPAALKDVPAGTGISTGGVTFITQSDSNFQYAGSGGSCFKFKSNGIAITAQQGGSNYNVSNATFTVAGRSDVTATGSASGGTDNIQQIVTQGDIDGATAKINQQNTSDIQNALYQQLQQQNLYPIRATFNAGTPNITTSAKAGDAASSVTVTESVTYTMFGTNRQNLVTLIKNDVGGQIDPSKQDIVNDGLDSATFNVQNASDTKVVMGMQTTATVGPKINTTELKTQVAGMKSGDAQNLINQIPGVTDTQVKLSPFWVGKIPKNTSKISITVGKAKQSNAGS